VTAERGRLDEAAALFGLGPAGEPTPLAGDVGGRRYFRVATAGGASALLVLYPEAGTHAQERWASLGRALHAAGVRVPELLGDAPELGAALVEDLGDRDLAAEIRESPREDRPDLLDEAEQLLYGIRSLPREETLGNPPFDAAFFAAELAHTRLWAFERGGEAPLPASRAEEWDQLAAELAEAAADPARTGDPVPTHRDFHANNLMRAPDGRLAAIDFQDLRYGPPDYDPVSLRFERAGESVPDDGSAFREAVLLERAWKVLGTFEKMLAKGRTIYAPHREATLRVLRRHTRRDAPWAAMLGFLT
jgi:aminoglycoside/choline kinase family phosphotransferase